MNVLKSWSIIMEKLEHENVCDQSIGKDINKKGNVISCHLDCAFKCLLRLTPFQYTCAKHLTVSGGL